MLTFCRWYACHLSDIALPINHRGYPRNILVKDEHFCETPFRTAGDWTETNRVRNGLFLLCLSISLSTQWSRGNMARHFADDICKFVFFYESCGIHTQISLRFLPRTSINNIKAQAQIMAWCQIGEKPLTWINGGLVYWRIQTSLGLDELIQYWLD